LSYRTPAHFLGAEALNISHKNVYEADVVLVSLEKIKQS
jgi:phosphopantothenate synthetase